MLVCVKEYCVKTALKTQCMVYSRSSSEIHIASYTVNDLIKIVRTGNYKFGILRKKKGERTMKWEREAGKKRESPDTARSSFS